MKTIKRTAVITIVDTYECNGTESELEDVKAGLEGFFNEYFNCPNTVEITEEEVITADTAATRH